MSVLTMPSSRTLSETELEDLTQLAVTLSGQLTRVQENGLAQAVAEALQRVAAATRVDGCQFIELDESGTVRQIHTPAGTAKNDRQGPVSGPGTWLVARLARGEVVAVSRPEDLPREAMAAREHGSPSDAGSLLGVPTSLAGRVSSALVLDGGRGSRRWSQALIERLQLVAEILSAALQRNRHESVLRANVARRSPRLTPASASARRIESSGTTWTTPGTFACG